MNPTLSMGIMAILIRIPGHLVRFFLRLYNLWCIFLDYVPLVYNKHGNEYWRRLWRFRRFNIIILAILYQNYCALMQFFFRLVRFQANFFEILCAVCIKSNTVMNIGVVYHDSDVFYTNSGHLFQNYCVLIRFLVRLIRFLVHFLEHYVSFV